MTDTTVSEPAQPSRVQIDPMAADGEARNEFYRNRRLLLENEVACLRAVNASQSEQLDAMRAELEARNHDIEAMQVAQKPKRSV